MSDLTLTLIGIAVAQLLDLLWSRRPVHVKMDLCAPPLNNLIFVREIEKETATESSYTQAAWRQRRQLADKLAMEANG